MKAESRKQKAEMGRVPSKQKAESRKQKWDGPKPAGHRPISAFCFLLSALMGRPISAFCFLLSAFTEYDS